MNIFKNIRKRTYLNETYSYFLERYADLQRDFDLGDRMSNKILKILVYAHGTLETLLFNKNMFPTIVNDSSKFTKDNIAQAFKTTAIFYIGNLLYFQPGFFSKKEIAQLKKELQVEEDPDMRDLQQSMIEEWKPLSKKEILQTEKYISEMLEFSLKDRKFLQEIKQYCLHHEKLDVAFYHKLLNRLLTELFEGKITLDPLEIFVFAQLVSNSRVI